MINLSLQIIPIASVLSLPFYIQYPRMIFIMMRAIMKAMRNRIA